MGRSTAPDGAARARSTTEPAAPSTTVAPPVDPNPPLGPEEARLLALARALAEPPPGPGPPGTSLEHALRVLASLPRGRSSADKARTLAVSWAREQARLALEEALARAAPRGRRAAPAVPLPLLAWLLVAASDAFGTEPAEALGERLAALADLISADAGRGRW